MLNFAYESVCAVLLCIGAVASTTRRDPLSVVLGLEVMSSAASLMCVVANRSTEIDGSILCVVAWTVSSVEMCACLLLLSHQSGFEHTNAEKCSDESI